MRRATPACARLSESLRSRRKPDVACLGRNPSSLLSSSDVGGKFHGQIPLQQHLGPSLQASLRISAPKGSGSGSSPAEQFHRSVLRKPVLPRRALRSCIRTAIPHLHFAPVAGPGRPGPGARSGISDPKTRFRRVQAQLPSPLRRYLTLLANFAFLGSICESRATLPGVRRPSDRSGSPREARSEGLACAAPLPEPFLARLP